MKFGKNMSSQRKAQAIDKTSRRFAINSIGMILLGSLAFAIFYTVQHDAAYMHEAFVCVNIGSLLFLIVFYKRMFESMNSLQALLGTIGSLIAGAGSIEYYYGIGSIDGLLSSFLLHIVGVCILFIVYFTSSYKELKSLRIKPWSKHPLKSATA